MINIRQKGAHLIKSLCFSEMDIGTPFDYAFDGESPYIAIKISDTECFVLESKQVSEVYGNPYCAIVRLDVEWEYEKEG